MSEHEEQRNRGIRDIFRVARFSRRQFLKRAGVTATGAVIGTIAMAAACKTSIVTTGGTTTASSATTINPVPADSKTTVSTPSAISSSSTASAASTPAQTSVAPTGVPAEYSYLPPVNPPQVIVITGTACTVATDRVYSNDNIWVKALSSNIAVMGITTTMVEILYEPYNIELPVVGDVFAIGDAFGIISGYKLIADLINPVSCKVLEVNDFLNSLVKQGKVLEPVINDPYNGGWLVVVQLSKPGELNNLMNAEAYRNLVKDIKNLA